MLFSSKTIGQNFNKDHTCSCSAELALCCSFGRQPSHPLPWRLTLRLTAVASHWCGHLPVKGYKEELANAGVESSWVKAVTLSVTITPSWRIVSRPKNDTAKQPALIIPESTAASPCHLTPLLSNHNLATDYTSLRLPDWLKTGHVVTSVTTKALLKKIFFKKLANLENVIDAPSPLLFKQLLF